MGRVFLHLFTFLILLQILSCNEKEEQSPVTYRFSLDSARAYIWADTGTYWVYKQSNTGDIDTQRVTSASTYWRTKNGTMDYSKHITVNYEKYSRTLHSSFFKYSAYDETPSPRPDGTGFSNIYNIQLERVISSEGINIPFFFPLRRYYYASNSSAETQLIIDDTTFIVSGKTYEHVAVFEVNLDEVEEGKFNCYNPNVRYYWAKGIGLIRKELITCGYSWDLVDYKLY